MLNTVEYLHGTLTYGNNTHSEIFKYVILDNKHMH